MSRSSARPVHETVRRKTGVNRVNGISFDSGDRKTPADAALKDATADARHKAQIMAAAAGVKLVRILSVSASEGGGGQVFARMELKAAPVPVMPGQQQITANATVRWEIAAEQARSTALPRHPSAGAAVPSG